MKYPNQQAFNINGKKNLTKKNAWWQHPPFNNNNINKNKEYNL